MNFSPYSECKMNIVNTVNTKYNLFLDNAVFLMLEYCPAGKLWCLVEPLVQQQLQVITIIST